MNNKLSTTKALMLGQYGVDLDRECMQVVFVGDAPNDAPMFEYFSHSVDVTNVRNFVEKMDAQSTFVSTELCGNRFSELVELLIFTRRPVM